MQLRLSAVLASSILVFAEAWPGVAQAQQAPDVTDVVALTNGGRFRGTITELVPDDHVVILLPTGETRRFEWSEVDYAGPVAKEPHAEPPAREPPSAPEPPITVKTDKIDVSVVSDRRDVQLLVRTGQADFSGAGYAWGGGGTISFYGQSRAYAIVCTAPCEARMPIGRHRLALAHDGGSAVEPHEAVTLHGPSKLELHYESRSTLRGVGWALAFTSLAVGGVLAVTAEHRDASTNSSSFDTNQIGLGLAVGGVGALVGLFLVLQPDSAAIKVVPLNTGSPSSLRRIEGALATTPPSGLAVRLSF